MADSPVGRYLRQRGSVHDALLAYLDWRTQCAAVASAYRRWVLTSASDARLAHAAYQAALDREEAAARMYASLAGQARQLVEAGLVAN
jgi:hypothetical protein